MLGTAFLVLIHGLKRRRVPTEAMLLPVCYAMSCTDIEYAATSYSCTVSGTDLEYAATRYEAVSWNPTPPKSLVPPYASAMRCPVLTQSV
eukprot:2731107-Rhodomonas_salina.3